MPQASGRPAKEAFLDVLEAADVQYVFGNPGTTEQGFLAALSDRPRLSYMLALHETVAVAMADGYARASGRVGFVNLHVTGGVANGLSQLYNAHYGRSPLVVTAGQSSTRHMIDEPLLSSDLVAMARQFTKWSWELRHPNDAVTALRRALKLVLQPPTGPVFLSLPIDLLDEHCDTKVGGEEFTSWSSESTPNKGAVGFAAELVIKAKNPVILCGDDVARSNASAYLVDLAETTGASVYAVAQSDLSFPNDHPLFARTLNVNSRKTIELLADADLIIAIGTPLFSQFIDVGEALLPPGVPVVHLDQSGWEAAKNTPVQVAIVGGLQSSCRDLRSAVIALAGPEYEGAAQQRRDAAVVRRNGMRSRLEKRLSATDSGAINPLELMVALRDAAPPDTIICDEAATTTGALHQVFAFSRPGSLFGARGGALGWGIPGALGVQLAQPSAPVIAVVGDGAAQYSIQALWTAAHYGLPVKVVVCNNRSYDILKVNMTEYLGEGTRSSQFLGMDLVSPEIDWVSLSTAYGVPARRVDTRSDLRSVLGEMIASDGPRLVDVRIRGFEVA